MRRAFLASVLALAACASGARQASPPTALSTSPAPETAPPKAQGFESLGLSGVGEHDGGRSEGACVCPAASEAGKPRMRAGALKVSGDLPPEVIGEVVRRERARFLACYERTSPEPRRAEVGVDVAFGIDRVGLVVNPHDVGSGVADAKLSACVRGEFARLRFPPPTTGEVEVVFPLTFLPP
jgi:hypothetical protein